LPADRARGDRAKAFARCSDAPGCGDRRAMVETRCIQGRLRIERRLRKERRAREREHNQPREQADAPASAADQGAFLRRPFS
jgi:hypothetical protein